MENHKEIVFYPYLVDTLKVGMNRELAQDKLILLQTQVEQVGQVVLKKILVH